MSLCNASNTIMSILHFMILSMFMYKTHYCNTSEHVNPEEIQHATCQILTKEFEASANATITRQLKGVCTTEELNYQFKEMEQRLIERMENLQKLITVTNLITETRNYKSSIEKKDTLIMRYAMDSNSSLEKSNLSEVLKFNDTIRETNEGSIYYYYWKIMNIHNLLTKFDLYVLSPDFGILGHYLQLQFYPNYPKRYQFAIQLKPASKSFIKKHKIVILRQSSNNLENIESNLLVGINIKFQLPINMIKEEGFIYNDSLIIGVEIQLES